MNTSSPLRNDRFDDFDQPNDDMIDKSYNDLVNQKNHINPTKDSEECLFNFMSLRKKSGVSDDKRSSSPVGEILSQNLDLTQKFLKNFQVVEEDPIVDKGLDDL